MPKITEKLPTFMEAFLGFKEGCSRFGEGCSRFGEGYSKVVELPFGKCGRMPQIRGRLLQICGRLRWKNGRVPKKCVSTPNSHVKLLFLQRLSMGKNPRIICLYSSLVKGFGICLFTSSTNCAQCSIISSIVQSCRKRPSL